MSKQFDFTTYISPFTWRYGSDEMRKIFSEENKYKIWRSIWVSLAKAQNKEGLVSKEELDDLIANQGNIDIERILEIEKDTKHDLVAGIKEFAEKAKIGGGKIHLGATSMDVVDNTDTKKASQAIDLVERKLKELLQTWSEKIEKYADFPAMAYTHLQPAEPTTLGYRFAFYAQDLILDMELLKFVRNNLKAKGLKGAVGTQASYEKLLNDKASQMEEEVMAELGISPILIANQTSPRKIDFFVSTLLSSIAQSLYKFAFDLRIMQSPGFGEMQEPFSENQVGSSAMPFKKNPVKSEQICSLARLVTTLARVSADNASLTLLERTIDDSANKRVYMPEMFLGVDEILNSALKIVSGLIINEAKIQENLDAYAPFSATEEIIIEAVKKGADRQKMHEILRAVSMEAWSLVAVGEENPMLDLLQKREEILQYIDKDQIKMLINPSKHLGTAPQRAKEILTNIKKYI